MSSRLRVVYLGHNPEFARAISEGGALVAVCRHPTEGGIGRRGRGLETFCRETGIPVRSLDRFDDGSVALLRDDRPDLLITGEFHLFVPRRVREIPRLGALNLHGALLPAYRGVHPLRWMVINGETRGGATLHYMNGKIDAGPIVAQAEYSIGPEDEVPLLRERYEACGREILKEALVRYGRGPVEGIPQDESEASYHPDRRPEDGRIDWNQPAVRVYDFIRALADLPVCAFTHHADEGTNPADAAAGIARPRPHGGDFHTGIEIFGLHPDQRVPPVTGGKNAISSSSPSG